jgi:hypothetical protein
VSASNEDFVAVDLHPDVLSRRVSRSSLYRMARDNRIPHAFVGRKLFVLRDFLPFLSRRPNGERGGTT